ncbi:hypothetical protein FQR65_LT01757 [Abscondita terminalis]|nr:hypothetical protein FQR65_LT01757 [Abscondita terminalis]
MSESEGSLSETKKRRTEEELYKVFRKSKKVGRSPEKADERREEKSRVEKSTGRTEDDEEIRNIWKEMLKEIKEIKLNQRKTSYLANSMDHQAALQESKLVSPVTSAEKGEVLESCCNAEGKPEGKVLLVVDGHSSHCNTNVLELAKEHEIIILQAHNVFLSASEIDIRKGK